MVAITILRPGFDGRPATVSRPHCLAKRNTVSHAKQDLPPGPFLRQLLRFAGGGDAEAMQVLKDIAVSVADISEGLLSEG